MARFERRVPAPRRRYRGAVRTAPPYFGHPFASARNGDVALL